MLTVNQALDNILHAGQCLGTETIPLAKALGRVIAQDVYAPCDVPPFDNSAMDGYALHTDSLLQGQSLSVSQRIPAGTAPSPLQKGTAARIFTGGALPPGANAVVMQEDCRADENKQSIHINTPVQARDNIRPQGQDIQARSMLFATGHKLRPQDIGLLASVGIDTFCAYKQARVALLGTGDELVEPGQPLQDAQIYNSNKYLLTSLLTHLGCQVHEPKQVGAIGDTLEETVSALRHCADAVDLIVTTGGVSVGEEDYIKPAVEQLGRIHNWKIQLKPGKPLVFGQIHNTLLLGLPGNPVSAFVTYLLFVAPLLRKLMGLKAYTVPPQRLPIRSAIDKPRRRPEYLRVRLHHDGVEIFDNQSSGVLRSTSWADALALIEEGRRYRPGDLVDVYPLHQLME